MNENEELKKEVEELRKIVEDLKAESIKIESNVAKLCRLKKEQVDELLKDEKEFCVIGRVQKFANEFTLDIFDDKYPKEVRQIYVKAADRIFGYQDEEERLQYYMDIYKQCVEFALNAIKKYREE